MSYNPAKDMPHTVEEFEVCVDYYFNKGVAEYEAEVASATAGAEAAYASLSDGADKPTLAAYIASAVRLIPKPQSKEEWEQHFRSVGYFPQAMADTQEETQGFSYDAYYKLADGRIYSVRDAAFVKVKRDIVAIDVLGGTVQDLKNLLIFYRENGYPLVKIGYELLTLKETKIAQIKEIDAQISENIKAGFGYAFDREETLYYSLSEIDQINLANYANAASLLIQSGKEGKISWQAWEKPGHAKGDTPVQIDLSPEDFISLYTQGALTHIQNCLSQGRAVKYEILAATTKEEVARLNVEPTQIAKARNG